MGSDKARFQHLRWWVLVLTVMLGACQVHPVPDSSPLLQHGDQVQLQYLYTNDGLETEAHLEIRADGTVVGAAYWSSKSLLQLKALKPGVIQILGVKTTRFLCQRPDGTLYGSLYFNPMACSFWELLLEDGYNVYESEFQGFPLCLTNKNTPLWDLVPQRPTCFLPLSGKPLKTSEPPEVLDPEPDVSSSDPMGLFRPSWHRYRSPSYTS